MDGRTPKVAWVTGASSGLGEALARALHARGSAVVLSGRREAALEALATELGADTLVLPFDAVDMAALPGAVERAWGWRGGVDLLVNNAGVSQRSLALDTTLDVHRTVMEVDYFAPVALTQLLLPRWVERGGGHVAMVSSVAGRMGLPLRAAYCAAKHALIGYADALRGEAETAYGLQVSTILPGSVRTQVAVNALQGDGSARGVSDVNIDAGMDPDVAAGRILDGLAQGRREIVVAEGRELAAVTLRGSDPERLFDGLAREGARLAALRAQGGPGSRPEPRKVAASDAGR